MDFPSGPWTGFYNYGRSTRKHRMDLVLTFSNHTISGDGSDDIGQFVITGRFDESGGFHIWPLGQGEGEQDYESAEEPAPVEAVATGVLPGSATPATAAAGGRSINARLTSSHFNQRRSPREICLRRRLSGTNPS
jgi:hypothetical protein